jgi:multiple sugar transport system substrate-binding protein
MRRGGLGPGLLLLLGACAAPPPPPPAAAAPVAARLDHLRALGLDLVVGGQPVRAVSVYAEAPDYRPAASPQRDGSEGVACVDDAARAAVVYLRHLERTADPQSRAEARGLLAFVAAMEQGDGRFANFVRADGAPNLTGPTSAPAFSYWGARSLWALGEARRVLGADADGWREVTARAERRFAAELHRDPGGLVSGSATATAEALLGVLALQRADPRAERAELALRAAQALARLSRGGLDAPPWGAHADPGAPWHAWGARTVQALAETARVLQRPELTTAARVEADGLWVRFLLAGQRPGEVAADGRARVFPQVAYGVAPLVEGALALAAASDDSRYATLAGLLGSWLTGANAAGTPMYDPAHGRTFDGIDAPGRVNRNAGAESTIEGLFALEALARDPEAAYSLHFRPVGDATEMARAPESRVFKGPSGLTLTLARGPRGFTLAESAPEPVALTYWPAANPVEVRLAQELAGRWNERHPSIQVRVQPLPAGRSSEEVLLAAIVGRATPDLCSNISAALLARLVRARGVLRLDTLAPTAARLTERASGDMLQPLRSPDGGIYTVPWKANPLMLMYDVDRLREAGVTPPRTHAELLAALRRLARDRDGDGRRDQWGLWAPLKVTWFERFFDFYPLYLAGSNGRTLLADGRVAFDDPAAVAALQVLRQGFAEGLLPRANFEGRDPFVDGTVAMKMVGPWFVVELESMKRPGFRYDVAPVPVPDTLPADATPYAFADLKGLVIFAGTRHPEAAARFAAWLTSPEADRLLLTSAAQLPYRRGLAEDPAFAEALARWPTLPAYAKTVEHSRDVDLHPDIVEVFDILSEAYEAGAIYGKVPAEKAIRDAALEVGKVIGAP